MHVTRPHSASPMVPIKLPLLTILMLTMVIMVLVILFLIACRLSFGKADIEGLPNRKVTGGEKRRMRDFCSRTRCSLFDHLVCGNQSVWFIFNFSKLVQKMVMLSSQIAN